MKHIIIYRESGVYMATVKIVPVEDMAILNKYLSGEDAVVLIPESFVKENKFLLKHIGTTTNDYYRYAGEPDIYIDIVNDSEHTFISYLNYKEEEESC